MIPRFIVALVLGALLGAACGRETTGSTSGPVEDPAGTLASPELTSPDRWCNAAGECPSPDRIHARDIPFERPGPEHCGWETATFIAFLDGQYVRDENGDVVTQGDVTYDPSGTLPRDAEFTGWQRGDHELWVSPSDRAGAFNVYRNIYIVRPDRVERLPHFDLGCF
jgi:hypothetical protein